jgi:tetratricopeptide (TPR) repeat protein
MIDRLDDAAPLCRQAIDANPTNAEAYNTTGVLLFKKHQFEDAEHSFKESIKYSPRYVFAWVNLAQSQTMLGRTQDAEESLRTAVEANNGQPSDAFSAALQDLASMYALQQNYEKSAENYRRLIYLRPNDALAHAGYAKTLLFQRQLDDAQNEAQTSVRLQPDLAEGWNILGLIMLERNQKKDAIDYFSKALQIKPDLSEAKENLARAQQDQ